MVSLTFELSDPGGNSIDLWRTIVSHGIASLPPMYLDEDARRLEATVPVAGQRPRKIRIDAAVVSGTATVEVVGRAPGRAGGERLTETLRHMLCLDEDMSEFYAKAKMDPSLEWVIRGSGRMMRSPTVYEDVVKTICTTNCSWALTKKMVGSLVQHLGEAATGAPESSSAGRAFPTPAAMAEAPEAFYRDVVRSGYRGPYLRSLARSVASGDVDLESLAATSSAHLSEDEVAEGLLALPGVGPYAAAHVMMLLGRYSRLILDSWTRPTYARLVGKRSVPDATIARRFRRYGSFAGLAFWLFITCDWVEDAAAPRP